MNLLYPLILDYSPIFRCTLLFVYAIAQINKLIIFLTIQVGRIAITSKELIAIFLSTYYQCH